MLSVRVKRDSWYYSPLDVFWPDLTLVRRCIAWGRVSQGNWRENELEEKQVLRRASRSLFFWQVECWKYPQVKWGFLFPERILCLQGCSSQHHLSFENPEKKRKCSSLVFQPSKASYNLTGEYAVFKKIDLSYPHGKMLPRSSWIFF